MNNIWDVYNFFRRLTDKDFLQPESVSEWLEMGQLAVFNQYRTLGLLDNRTQEALAPFAKEYPFTASSAGHFTKPADFVQALRVVSDTGNEYTPILFAEMRDALISALEPISQYPRYQQAGSYIALYPMSAVNGTLTYYRLPTAPVIGYTPDGDGMPVYNSGTSIQLEIPTAYWLEVIIKALPFVGVNLADSDVYALAQQNEGKA